MKRKALLLGLIFFSLASGCESLRHDDFNNWGVPENPGHGDVRWHWTPW